MFSFICKYTLKRESLSCLGFFNELGLKRNLGCVGFSISVCKSARSRPIPQSQIGKRPITRIINA